MAGKQGAPKGNQNARGTGGARSAFVGSLIGGPIGAGLTGAYVGGAKNQRAASRHTKTATGLGVIGGGISGAFVGGSVGSAVVPFVGTAIGAGVGAGLGAIGGGTLNYVGSKSGQAVGRLVFKRKP